MIRRRYSVLVSSMAEEWRALLRHPSIFIVLLGLPIIYPVVVSSLYANHQAEERRALIVDQDGSSLSRALTTRLDATRELRVVARPETFDEAVSAVRRQEAEVLVFVPAGLARQVKRGEQAQVRVWVDASNVYTYGLAFGAFNGVLLDLNRELGREALQLRRGLTPTAAERRAMPLGWDERLVFHPTGAYGDFLVPGVLLIVIQQLVLLSLSFSLGWQREDRRAARPVLGDGAAAAAGAAAARGLPFTRIEGRALAHLAFHVAGIALIVFGVFPAFGWPLQSSLAAFVLFVALAVAMVPPAMLVASLAPDRYLPFQLLMFFSAPVFMMSGFSWPLWRMPAVVRALAWIFPATPALHALRILTMKSGALGAVMPQLGSLAIQFVAWTLLAAVVVRWRAARSGPASPEPSSPKQPFSDAVGGAAADGLVPQASAADG